MVCLETLHRKTMKDISTLVEDIYNVADPESHFDITREVLTPALKDISMALTRTLTADDGSSYYIRPSNVGRGLRWHYFMHKFPNSGEKFNGQRKLLFQAGHIQEAILLMYIKLAGHKVTHEQGKAEINGVSGSMDCVIDDYLIDVKTTSDYSFKKFKEGTIDLENDPFGYIAQLSTYKAGLLEQGVKIKGQGWLAYNKNNSELALHLIPDNQLIDANNKIDGIRAAQEGKDMPKELCPGSEPKVEANGNKQMAMTCEYCPFKDKCWPDFKVYRYSNKDRFYVDIVKEPRVEDVTDGYK